jgi:chemotaxis protein CheX
VQSLLKKGRKLPMKGKSVNDDELEKILAEATTTVFTTMLSFKVEPGKIDGPIFNGDTHIAGAVGFTGAYNGIIYLYSSATFARLMTCSLLGMTDEEIEGDDMVNDAMGELTNMVAGNVKSRLDNHGAHCTMTIPSVVRGADFQIEPVSGVRRRSILFQCEGGAVMAEALIKSSSDSQEN